MTTAALDATTAARSTDRNRSHWIEDWRPEDEAFWAAGGEQVARRNLTFSVLSEHIGFSVWTMWSVLVLFLGPQYGFTPADKFLLTAVPALRGIRAAHPSAEITLVGPAPIAGLLPPSLVDRVVDASWVRGVPPVVLDLAPPGLAVNLHGRGPQSTALLQASAPGRLVSYGLPDGPRWDDDEHEVARWCRLLVESGIPADPRDLLLAPPATEPGRDARSL